MNVNRWSCVPLFSAFKELFARHEKAVFYRIETALQDNVSKCYSSVFPLYCPLSVFMKRTILLMSSSEILLPT